MGSRSPYVFALPYLYNKTEFMAFFFELLGPVERASTSFKYRPVYERSTATICATRLLT